MFSLFRRNPAKNLKKRYESMLQQAMFAQRHGDIKTYSQLTAEAEEVRLQIQLVESLARS